MIKNYFKTAFRNLLRNKVYAMINIFGLAIGIASALLVFLLVQFELSYDTYHKNFNNIYHLLSYDKIEGDYSPGVALPTRKALELDFPAIKAISNITSKGDVQIDLEGNLNIQTRRFKEEEGVFYTDPDFFEIFDYEWIIGNPKNSLGDPGKVVLSESIAEKYFGSYQKAMGKTLRLDQIDLLKVSGIIKDPPKNTDFPLAIIGSYQTLTSRTDDGEWGGVSSSDHVYMLLPETISEAKIEKELKNLVIKHRSKKQTETFALVAQKLKDIHYDARAENFSGRIVGNEIIMALSLVGIFLIVVACINFVNLATAQAVNRSREVGVRKVLGSSKRNLLHQFLGETFIIVLFSVLLAIALVELVIPQARVLLQTHIEIDFVKNPTLFAFLALITLSVTLLAGFYPALVMARFNPVQALKNKISNKTVGGFSLRRVLVILQFALAQILIIGITVGLYQMQYIQSMPLGFDNEAVLTVSIPAGKSGGAMTKSMETFRRDLKQIPGVEAVSFANRTPSSNSTWTYNFNVDGKHKQDRDVDVNIKMADADYIKTYKLNLIAGRNYVKSDTISELVVNETLVKRFGFENPADIIGEIGLIGGKAVKIVGVVKDFHLSSLHEPIAPCVISTSRGNYYELGLKVSTKNLKSTLKEIGASYAKFYPKHLFEYKFLDEIIREYYELEDILMAVFRLFAGIGIFISSLGLYGLVSFMAVQRNKEVGIRKVLGATFGDICLIFYKEFIWLVLVAFVIATPFSWYVMSGWLQDFAYRIQLHWWIFALSGLSVALLAVLIISTKAFISARINPVEALRYE